MAEEIRLIGSFQDGITPKLNKLQRNIDKMVKSFNRLNRKLAETTSLTKSAASSMENIGISMAISTGQIKAQTTALRAYNAQLKAARRNAKGFRAPAIPGAPNSRRGGRVAAPRGARQATTPRAVAPSRGAARNRPAVVGAGGLFGPMLRAGIALDMIQLGARSAVNALQGLAGQAREAELGMIQMANVIQTIGEVGDYGESARIATQMREDLARIAVELPGGTNDFITIQTRILDDMILSMGSLEAVQKDLDKGARSFVGLFGTFARLAGLDPTLAARDLDQLRRSPNQLRHIEILTRNANLMRAYQEEIAKTPNDFMGALYRAMEMSATPQMIEAVRNSFDVALETIFDTLFNEVRGIFGTMRKTGFMLQGEFYDAGVSLVDSLGIATRQIGEVIKLLSEAVGTGAIEAINGFLFETALLFYVMRLRVAQAGGELERAFYGMVRDVFANLTEFVVTFDYGSLAYHLEAFISALFQGIGLGLERANANGGFKGNGAVVGLGALALAARQAGFSLDNLKNGINTILKGPAGSSGGMVANASGASGYMRFPAFVSGASGKNFFAGLKAVSKRLLILGGVIEMVTDLMEGKSMTEAFASGLGNIGGTVLGAAIGTVIAPGIGTAIGAFLGGWIGGSDGVSQPLSATLTEVMGAFDGLVMSVNAILAPINDLVSTLPGMSGDFNILSAILSALLSPFALLEIGLYGLAETINNVMAFLGNEEARERAIEAGRKRQAAEDRFTITRRRDMGGHSLASQLEAEDKKLADAIAKGDQKLIARIRAYRQEIINLMPANQRPVAPPTSNTNFSPNTPEGREAGMQWWMQQRSAGNVPAQTVEKISEPLKKMSSLSETANAHTAHLEPMNNVVATIPSDITKVSDLLGGTLNAKITNPGDIKLTAPINASPADIAPITPASNLSPAGVTLKVENTFNAAQMDQDEMADAVSASILRAMDDAGYSEVFTS